MMQMSIPLRSAVVLAVTLAAVVISPVLASAYTVVEGDTLSSIAGKTGASVSEIIEANDIADPDLIVPGQEIVVPGSGGGEYTVRPGDTLSAIASRFGVEVSAIAAANDISDPNRIFSGQTLVIPRFFSALVRPAAPQVESLLEQFAVLAGLDPGLVKALAYLESGWQQGVISSTNAIGIMQIMPETWRWLESDVFGHPLDIQYSMYDNIKAGVRYLAILMGLTGDVEQALAAYYQGYGALSRGIMYSDTIQYVADVLAIKDAFWP